MNRINQTFSQLKSIGKKALIPYVTVGDPASSIDENINILNALSDNGADLIELGIPFSDPAADGETIQLAGQRALEKGITFNHVLSVLRAFRKNNQQTPIILMGYLNSFERHGVDTVFADIARAGADGVILVDCPIEGYSDYQAALQQAGLANISLIAPTTHASRAEEIMAKASGFIYYVSLLGVTGKQKASAHGIKAKILELKKQTDTPICVGFGIRDEQTAKGMAEFADGVIIGSALVKLLYDAQRSEEDVVDAAKTFTDKMRRAIDA